MARWHNIPVGSRSPAHSDANHFRKRGRSPQVRRGYKTWTPHFRYAAATDRTLRASRPCPAPGGAASSNSINFESRNMIARKCAGNPVPRAGVPEKKKHRLMRDVDRKKPVSVNRSRRWEGAGPKTNCGREVGKAVSNRDERSQHNNCQVAALVKKI